MKDDEKLAADEARRIAQHESVKGDVREKVHAEISRKTDERSPADEANADALAESLKRKAVREVAATESDLERGQVAARASQIVDYLFYIVYGIIGLEIVLDAIGARQSAGFKQFIDAIATPLLAPFKGLMPTPGVGSFRFMLSYIVALVVYVLLHMAVNGLFRLFVHRKTVV
jgi:uncharacterized protein YggT (Ycf19 family)